MIFDAIAPVKEMLDFVTFEGRYFQGMAQDQRKNAHLKLSAFMADRRDKVAEQAVYDALKELRTELLKTKLLCLVQTAHRIEVMQERIFQVGTLQYEPPGSYECQAVVPH